MHSEPERVRYARHFGLPQSRFELIRWGVKPSSVEIGEESPLIGGRYICALGKDGRDYQTLVEAMRALPDLRLVLVAQPHNIENVRPPENVQIFCDVPPGEAMNILKHSQFMALPLQSGSTSCGHITIVSAMFSRKAVVATRSEGIRDYFPESYPAPRVEAGDVVGWRQALVSMTNDGCARHRSEDLGFEFALQYCSHEAVLQGSLGVFRAAGVDLA